MHSLFSSRPYFPVPLHATKNKTCVRVCVCRRQGTGARGGVLRSSPAGLRDWAFGTSHPEMCALRVVSCVAPAGFGVPVVAEGEVRQRVQDALAGAAADPRDRRGERAQDPHGRAPPGEHRVAAQHPHAARPEHGGQLHRRHPPQQAQGKRSGPGTPRPCPDPLLPCPRLGYGVL